MMDANMNQVTELAQNDGNRKLHSLFSKLNSLDKSDNFMFQVGLCYVIVLHQTVPQRPNNNICKPDSGRKIICDIK